MATGSAGSVWAGDVEVGGTELRKEVVDIVIKGRADPTYKWKQAVAISKTNANKNTFWREDPDSLDEPAGGSIKGIPRGGDFPQGTVQWEEHTAVLQKYGFRDFVFWEDIRTNDINVMKRTIYKITDKTIKTVDEEIKDILSEGGTPVDIQSVTITGSRRWAASSAAIMDDMMHAKQLIGEKDYDTSNLMMFISEQDHRNMVNYIYEKGAQAPSFGTEVAKNGRVGGLAGIKNIVVTNSLKNASFALVVVPKVCGTWKENFALSSDLTSEPFKGTRVTVCEVGVTQLTDPKAICMIKDT